MKRIHAVCVEYNIKYWLDYGTLPGAIYHDGFIPWDDDMDICMMREDYEKFCKIVPAALGEEFFWQTKPFGINAKGNNISSPHFRSCRQCFFLQDSEKMRYIICLIATCFCFPVILWGVCSHCLKRLPVVRESFAPTSLFIRKCSIIRLSFF